MAEKERVFRVTRATGDAGMLRLTLACGDYDRTRPLVDGRVRPLGIDLNALPMTIEEIFFRMARFREFDAAEMSLGSYLVSLSAGEAAPFVAIPVFPSRSFRHSGIYVHAGQRHRAARATGRPHRRGGRVPAHRERVDPRHPG